jgi:hypothetical protein
MLEKIWALLSGVSWIYKKLRKGSEILRESCVCIV